MPKINFSLELLGTHQNYLLNPMKTLDPPNPLPLARPTQFLLRSCQIQDKIWEVWTLLFVKPNPNSGNIKLRIQEKNQVSQFYLIFFPCMLKLSKLTNQALFYWGAVLSRFQLDMEQKKNIDIANFSIYPSNPIHLLVKYWNYVLPVGTMCDALQSMLECLIAPS